MKSLQFTSAAQDRPHTAVQIIQQIRERCEVLRYHPEMGSLYPKISSEIRAIPQQR